MLTFRSNPDDNDYYSDEIECARCGNRFYYELLECPHCGARVYSGFDEDDNLLEPDTSSYEHQSWFVEIGAVLSGWFIVALIITVLFLPLRNAFSIQQGTPVEHALLYILAGLGGFLASWIVVRFAGRHWKLYGLVIGIGSLLAAGSLYGILYAEIQPLLMDMMTWIVMPVVLLASWGGAGLAERMFRTPDAGSLFGDALQEKVLSQRLLTITRNDRTMVERLIAFEKQRKPNASRIELMKMAVQRWERDNR
jgi:DNA-directed RNA polymerase subunit RPC12/RpoP